MSRFEVEWVDERGERARAELEASGRDAALEALAPEQRATLVRLAPLDAAPQGPGDVAWAGRALAGLLSKGVPLAPALRHLARARRAVAVGELERAAAAADEGGGLAASLERGALGPALASPLVRGMVETGERASRLPALLLEAAHLAERLAHARRRALDALAYPAVVVAFAVVFVAGVATTTGWGMGELLRTQPEIGQPGRPILDALAWAGARPALTWGAAVVALVGLGLLWRSAGVGLAPLRLRPVRDAAVLQALAALIEGGLAPADAARVLDEGAPGLLPRGAAGPLIEGAAPADALARGGVVDPAESLALAAAARVGDVELAAALREVAGFRVTALEDRSRRLARALGLAVEVGVGLAVLAMAIPFLGSRWS